MAELTQKERLQPSLLDRLTSDDPDRNQGYISPARLRECVRRDLTWLLNTTNLACLQDLAEFPNVAMSVVNYGMPDLAGHTASSVDIKVLERALLKVIWDFEPRLSKSTVRVRLVVDADKMSHNAMSFDIEADLWAQPTPLRLLLRTDIDLETGSVNVSELGQR